MPTEPPPSRYRVEERDGRLVVIDNGEQLEPLVKHSHEVVTPGKMRARANKRNIRHGDAKTPVPATATGQTVTLPIGPGGEMREIELDGGMMGRFVATIFGLLLFFVFAGPFFVFVIIALIAFGANKRGDERIFTKAIRGWGRWVAGIAR